MMKILIPFLFLLPLVVGFAQRSTDSAEYHAMVKEEKAVVAAYAKVLDAVVCLEGILEDGAASGSGTIVSKDGLILTAAHVVGDAKEMFVNLVDGRSAPVTVLGCDFERDVAMVKIAVEEGEKAEEWPFVELGDSKDWAVAQTYIALGHAGGYDLHRPPPIRIGWSYNRSQDQDFIVTDCAVIGGDSGGPLLDLDGKLVGIHSFIGASLGENNHAPVHAVQENWDRLLRGDRWGDFPEIGFNLGDDQPLSEDKADRFNDVDGKVKKSLKTVNRDEFFRFMEVKIREAAERGEDPNDMLNDPLKLLRQYGLPRKELRRVGEEEVEQFFMDVMGDQGLLPFSEEALKGVEIPEGLDVLAFGDALMSKIDSIDLDLTLVSELMKKHGATAASLSKLSEEELSDMMMKMLGMPPLTAQEKQDKKTLQNQMEACFRGHRPSLEAVYKNTVALSDRGRLLCHGVVVDGRGFILTKYSEIRRAKRLMAQVQSPGGGEVMYSATKVKHWDKHDLALVFVDLEGVQAIQWFPTLPPIGSYLSSPDYKSSEPIGVGLLSVGPRSLREENRPFLGIGFGPEEGVVIGEVIDGSSASKAGLNVKDLITMVDGKEAENIPQFIREVSTKKVGDTLQLAIKRGDELLEFDILLGKREDVIEDDEPQGDDERFDLMNQMSGEMSKVRTGFPQIIQTDLPIEPNQIGGALVDLKGNAIGLNIARAGRIESYAIPAAVVLELLSEVDYAALANEAREPEAEPVAAGAEKQ